MLFKHINELQDFIIWAKKQKVQHFKAGEIEILFSGHAFLDEEVISISKPLEERNTAQTLTSAELSAAEAKEDEETLMWSAD